MCVLARAARNMEEVPIEIIEILKEVIIYMDQQLRGKLLSRCPVEGIERSPRGPKPLGT